MCIRGHERGLALCSVAYGASYGDKVALHVVKSGKSKFLAQLIDTLYETGSMFMKRRAEVHLV